MAKAKKNIILPPAVGAYVNLFTPQVPPVGSTDPTPRYSLNLIYPKATADVILKPLRDAIEEVAIGAWGAEEAARRLKFAKNPTIKDGDDYFQRTGDATFKGAFFIRVATKASPNRLPPGVLAPDGVSRVKDDSGAYSGCTFRVAATVKPYEKEVNNGVTLYLNNAKVVKYGPRMDGRRDAADEFAEYGDESSEDENGTPIGGEGGSFL